MAQQEIRVAHQGGTLVMSLSEARELYRRLGVEINADEEQNASALAPTFETLKVSKGYLYKSEIYRFMAEAYPEASKSQRAAKFYGRLAWYARCTDGLIVRCGLCGKKPEGTCSATRSSIIPHGFSADSELAFNISSLRNIDLRNFRTATPGVGSLYVSQLQLLLAHLPS